MGPDEIFLEQRRRALSRFLNFIYNHPVLRTDDTVLAFLTIDSDIQTYRKSVTNSIIDEEYLTAEITDAMLARIPDNFDDVILKFKKSIVELTDYFRAFASLMEKVVRRIDGKVGWKEMCVYLRCESGFSFFTPPPTFLFFSQLYGFYDVLQYSQVRS